MEYWGCNTTKRVDSISGCFLWVKREVFKEVGLLDENFFMYYEDTEFCWRVKVKSQFNIYFYPEAEIIHLEGMSSSKVNYNRLKLIYKSARYYINKRHGKKSEKCFVFLCNLSWRVERLVFSVLKSNIKFKKKYDMLNQLLCDEITNE
jgi:hypothetical protein